MSRFTTYFNSLPSYGNAGQGWDIMLFRKTDTGNKFNLYPKHRYRVGSGTSAKIITIGGEQYIIAFFSPNNSNIYYSLPGIWSHLADWKVNFENIRVADSDHYNFQRLQVGQQYPFWRKLDDDTDPFIMIYPAEENQLLTQVGFNAIPYNGKPISVHVGKEPVIENTENTENTKLEERKSGSYLIYILLWVGVLVVIGLILIFSKK